MSPVVYDPHLPAYGWRMDQGQLWVSRQPGDPTTWWTPTRAMLEKWETFERLVLWVSLGVSTMSSVVNDPHVRSYSWRLAHGRLEISHNYTDPADWWPPTPEQIEAWTTLERLVLWVSLGYEP